MNKKYFGCAVLAAVLFGLSTPLSKILLDKINPALLSALYYLGAAIFLAPFSCRKFTREFSHLKQNSKDVYRLAGAVVFGGIAGPLCLIYGIREINATSASLLLNMETVATTFLAWLFFREGMSKRVLVSSLFTVVAGVLLVMKTDYQISLGGILVVLACVSWGLDNNFTAAVEGVSPGTNTIIKGCIAGTFNLLLSFGIYGVDGTWQFVLLALVIGSVTYGVSIVLYITSARKLGAARSQIIFSINPFLGGLVSFLIFHDPLSLKFYFALGIMMLALFVLYYERHGHDHVHEEQEHEHEHTHEDGHHDHTHDEGPCGETHTHMHLHSSLVHNHLHYPDVHHRHKHE